MRAIIAGPNSLVGSQTVGGEHILADTPEEAAEGDSQGRGRSQERLHIAGDEAAGGG